MSSKVDGCASLLAVLILIVVVGLPVFFWNWYKAGVQAAQYERQGIHMTRWEVFIGIKPAETVVQIRQPEKP